MLSVLPYILTIFLAFGGILITIYIRHKKQAGEKMACPLHSDCEAVVLSEYSRFLGIPVELLGMFYYALVAISYAVFLVVPSLASPLTVFALGAISTAAFLFSLYLIFIQAFFLKQWCTWCLISAGLSTGIFLLVIISSGLGFVPLLAANRHILVILHLLGFALGIGGATVSDMLFFRFLKDFRISHFEAGVMRSLHQLIWLALALLVLTGIGLFLPESERLLQSPKFLAKMTIVAVIIINGAFLGLKISPQLVRISFGQERKTGKLFTMRRLAFAMGGVSFVSWYTAFLLGITPSIPLRYPTLILIYLALVTIAVTGSQILERVLERQAAQA